MKKAVTIPMYRPAVVALLLVIIATPLFGGKTRKELYPVPCSILWPAVKDALRSSERFGIVYLDNAEMIASFSVAWGNGFRIETAVLYPDAEHCELHLKPLSKPPISGDDAGDLKNEVDAALTRLGSAQPANPKKDDSSPK